MAPNKRFYGPTMNALAAARESGREENCTANSWLWRKHITKALTAARRYLPPFCE
jgi:hypothetical protein